MTTGLFAKCNISPSRFFEGRLFKESRSLSLSDLLKLSLLNFLPSHLISNLATSSRSTIPINFLLSSFCFLIWYLENIKAKSRIIIRIFVAGSWSYINGYLSSMISSTANNRLIPHSAFHLHNLHRGNLRYSLLGRLTNFHNGRNIR